MIRPLFSELDVPGLSGKRYLALTGIKDGRLFIEPTISGHHVVRSRGTEDAR
jgi:hypothetical protein